MDEQQTPDGSDVFVVDRLSYKLELSPFASDDYGVPAAFFITLEDFRQALRAGLLDKHEHDDDLLFFYVLDRMKTRLDAYPDLVDGVAVSGFVNSEDEGCAYAGFAVGEIPVMSFVSTIGILVYEEALESYLDLILAYFTKVATWHIAKPIVKVECPGGEKLPPDEGSTAYIPNFSKYSLEGGKLVIS